MHKRSHMMVLLTAMAVLLPLLAALQYYWLGQVSEAASERLQVSLRASANRFRQDFNREFIRAYLNFQMDSLAPAQDIERYHLERLEHWNQTTPYARLISEVFVVNYDEQGRPHLSRLNAQAGRFELTEWSGELMNLRDRFERRDDSRLNVETSGQNALEPFAEDTPALIVPFPFVPTDKSQGGNPALPSGFTIIKLDLNYLQREFIPSLIQRHFDDSLNEYKLAIISIRHPERVIYSSRYPAVDLSPSDVSTRIFGLESDELRAFATSDRTSTAGGEQPTTRQLRLIKLREPKDPAAVSSMSSGEGNGHWQLLIKHQAGSLAAAVNVARRRNLAISFGILLLLAAGILMTAISTRRAERLARQQINFVAGVTHELRTPLAVICSAGENLADGIIDSPEKVAQYGDVVHREGQRLTDMVEQVLEFAGAQSGQQRYEFRPVSAADLIDGALAACRAQIQERDFNVETMIEKNLPRVRGDGAALKRALQNLISNAIKYDGENRWARISAQPGTGKHGNEVRIAVEDRGLGIGSVDIAHIFEPFYRGHEAVAAQIKGSGVGLSLVKQIVEAHGGRVTVKSTQGTGSVFTLHLPIASDES
jgi:signal transduction histidine kinase